MDTYSVHIEWRGGDPAALTDAFMDAFLDDLAEYGAVVSGGSGHPSFTATIFVEDSDPFDAARAAHARVATAAFNAGLPGEQWDVVRVEAVREDVLDEDLERPQLPELVSGPEAAAIAGVSIQRWHRLVAAHPDRLEPAIERPHAMLWFRAGVEKFASEKRRPGRPSKDSAA